ncbi:MAG: hypothetical protein ABEH83_05850 [Halobacterium sp.]
MTDSSKATLLDPESLREDDAVDVQDVVHDVAADDYADVESLDSHVVVGVTDSGSVLLQNDGHHGWTLPAFPVADDDDWLAVAHREFEALTGTRISIEAPLRLRSREYRVVDGEESATVRDLVVRGTPATGLPADPESRVDGTDLRWDDAVPDDAPEPVADDISLFVE